MDFSTELLIFCKLTASCFKDGKFHYANTSWYTLNVFISEASWPMHHLPATFNVIVMSNPGPKLVQTDSESQNATQLDDTVESWLSWLAISEMMAVFAWTLNWLSRMNKTIRGSERTVQTKALLHHSLQAAMTWGLNPTVQWYLAEKKKNQPNFSQTFGDHLSKLCQTPSYIQTFKIFLCFLLPIIHHHIIKHMQRSCVSGKPRPYPRRRKPHQILEEHQRRAFTEEWNRVARVEFGKSSFLESEKKF